MSLQLRIQSDTITPDLKKKLGKVKDPTPIWRAVGTQVLSIATRSFREPNLRIAAWPNKKALVAFEDGSFGWTDGGPSNLIRKGTLKASLRLVTVTQKGVTLGSDRVYAAIHQLGGEIKPKKAPALTFSVGGVGPISLGKVTMPPRPYLPFDKSGALAPMHQGRVLAMFARACEKALGLK